MSDRPPISPDSAFEYVMLPTLGRVRVREPATRVSRYRGLSPFRINYRDYADAVLGRAVGSEVAAHISELPAFGRRKLMCSVVRLLGAEREWTSLHGSHLSVDERFFVVMRETDLRGRLAFIRRMRERPLSAKLARDPTLRVKGQVMGASANHARHAGILALGNTPAMKLALGGSPMLKLAADFSPKLKLVRGDAPSSIMRGASAGLASSSSATVAAQHAGPFTTGNRVSERLRTATGALGFGSVAKVGGVPTTLLDPRSGVLSAAGASDMRGWLGASQRPGKGAWLAAAGLGVPDATMRHVMELAKSSLGSQMRDVGHMQLGKLARTRGFTDTDRWVSGFRLAVPAAKILSRPRIRPLSGLTGLPVLPRLDALLGTRGLVDRVFSWQDWMVRLARESWREHPLGLILVLLDLRRARSLALFSEAEVEEVLLDAMETVAREGPLVTALHRQVAAAPLLNDLQRSWLHHGLEHAEAGDWDQAVLPLIAGIEGALAAEALVRELIRSDETNFLAAEGLVKRLMPSGDFFRLVTRRAYGGRGNSYRHGRAAGGTRDQTLYLLLALAGWADEFVDDSTLDVTSTLVGDGVPLVLERPSANANSLVDIEDS